MTSGMKLLVIGGVADAAADDEAANGISDEASTFADGAPSSVDGAATVATGISTEGTISGASRVGEVPEGAAIGKVEDRETEGCFRGVCFGWEVEKNFEVKTMFYSETGGHVLTSDFDTSKIGVRRRGDRKMRRDTRAMIGNRPIGATVKDRPIDATVEDRPIDPWSSASPDP
uniref:Uncharacterized protein n=1 Tax=Setaria viridis TaxID=4556 RepID=A0A4U6TY40_SETVI|nr:hypothetical protein SEVIR_7G300500v2 [Setaria viridis]